jgi:hypothetical protein
MKMAVEGESCMALLGPLVVLLETRGDEVVEVDTPPVVVEG